VLRELGALTPAQRAAHAEALAARAEALAARAEAMAADRAGYTDEQRTAQRVAEVGCQVTPEAAGCGTPGSRARRCSFHSAPSACRGAAPRARSPRLSRWPNVAVRVRRSRTPGSCATRCADPEAMDPIFPDRETSDDGPGSDTDDTPGEA
jgi:hypothetical protein